MKDLKDILKLSEEIDHEEFLKYLEGNASQEERYAIEKMMADDHFVNDAVEGLQDFKDPKQVAEYINQLNRQLLNHTQQKLNRKKKRKLVEQNWLIIAILSILFICIAGYFLIHFYSKSQ